MPTIGLKEGRPKMPLPDMKARPMPELRKIVHIETVDYRADFSVDVVVDGDWVHHMQVRWFALRYLKDRYSNLRDDLNVSHLKITGRSYGIVMPVPVE